MNIALNPVERQHLVKQAAIGGQAGQMQKSFYPDAVIHADNNNALLGKAGSIIETVVRIAAHEPAAWNPNHYWSAAVFDSLVRRPNAEIQAIEITRNFIP